MYKKTVRDIDVKNKTILVRASLNVPIEDGKVMDRLRIEAGIPTLKYLLEQGSRLVLMSHHSEEGVSLKPIAPILSELLGRPVEFIEDPLSPDTKGKVKKLTLGDVVLFENLRFNKGEEANDPEFAKSLALLGDVYVDDDFTTMHREHASIVGIPMYLPAVAGFQVEKEVDTIMQAMESPKRPLIAIVGGAKISTKIDFINNFLAKAEALLVGGAMANNFLAAQGLEVGKSMVEKEEIPIAKKIIESANQDKAKLFLPVDVVVTDDLEKVTNVRTTPADQVEATEIIADIGPESVAQIQQLLDQKGTVIWNGPLGITETEAFTKASQDLAERIIKSDATSIIGGGDTAGFIDSAGLHDKFSFVSTGGGASLELMSGKKLPGIEALDDKPS